MEGLAPLVVGSVLLVAGATSWFYYLRDLALRRDLRRRGLKAQGDVISQTKSDYTIEFVDPKGHKHTKYCIGGQGRLGATFLVRHDPERPERFIVEGTSGPYFSRMGGFIFTLFGVASLAAYFLDGG